jgi:N-acyl-L-homoserine lactone synthetase
MLSYGRFRFLLADTEELEEKTYRLRYEVYVEEFGFEKPADHPGGLERDGHDAEAVHFAALDRDDEVVGTIRLILHSENGFPAEKAAKVTFPGRRPPPERIAEISRLAVSRKYRRRWADLPFVIEPRPGGPGGGWGPGQGWTAGAYGSLRAPVIVMGLYQVMYQESKRRGLTHWFMITEEKVHRIFKRYGFLFCPVGETVEYHGWRRPYLGVIEEMERKMVRRNPVLMQVMLKGLERRFQPGTHSQPADPLWTPGSAISGETGDPDRDRAPRSGLAEERGAGEGEPRERRIPRVR